MVGLGVEPPPKPKDLVSIMFHEKTQTSLTMLLTSVLGWLTMLLTNHLGLGMTGVLTLLPWYLLLHRMRRENQKDLLRYLSRTDPNQLRLLVAKHPHAERLLTG